MKRIYLDYASLTPVDKRVLVELKKHSGAAYANPSSIYKEGVAAKKAVGDARKAVGSFLNARSDEIVFTSGGTEANGLALEGAGRTAHRNGIAKPHLVISNIEHSSIMETAAMLERHGVEVTRVPVGRSGRVRPEEVRKSIRPNTFMVSVMAVNNEIGTIQPIRDMAKAIRWARANITKSKYPLFHTDAAQAALYEDLNVERLGVDLLALDGSKVYGPRGIGALYIRRGTPIEPIVYGGGQERGLRSGTENVPAIMGFAKALEIAAAERSKERRRIGRLKEGFLKELRKARPDLTMNPTIVETGRRQPVGSSRYTIYGITQSIDSQSPHILNVSIPGIDNEFFVLQLDARGIAVSTKSSCLRDQDESYVLKAISADSRAAIRFSLGRFTKKGDITAANKAILAILKGV